MGSCGPQLVSLALSEPQQTCFVWHEPLLFGSSATAYMFAFFLLYIHVPVCVCMCLLCPAFHCLRFEYLDYFEMLFWLIGEAALPHTFGCAVLLALLFVLVFAWFFSLTVQPATSAGISLLLLVCYCFVHALVSVRFSLVVRIDCLLCFFSGGVAEAAGVPTGVN